MTTVNVTQQNVKAASESERILAHQLAKRYTLSPEQLEQVSGSAGGWPTPTCWETRDPSGHRARDCTRF